MHVQADGVDFEAGALGLAGPVEIGRGLALELFQRGAHHRVVTAGQGVVDQSLDLDAAHVELQGRIDVRVIRSEEHTSELQSLMRISYAVFCLKKKTETK